MTEILRRPAMTRLERALERAVTRRERLATARDVLLTPLEALEAIAGQSRPVLRGDEPATELLRTMVAGQAAAMLAMRHSVGLREPGADACEELADLPSSDRCTPGLVALGELVLAGLAAGIAGRRSQQTELFVETVFGLAAAAAPAEMLARALGEGLADHAVLTVLEGMSAPDRSDAFVSAQVRTFLDEHASARRRCLVALERLAIGQLRARWDGHEPGMIGRVTTRARGGEVELVVGIARGPDGDESLSARALLVRQIAEGEAFVVLAARTVEPTFARVVRKNEKKATVTVEVPPEARAGWLGVAGRDRLRSAWRARVAARRQWEDANAHACLSDAPVDLDALAPPSVPNPVAPLPVPFEARASWGARIVELELSGANPPDPATLVAIVQPADVASDAEVQVDGLRICARLHASRVVAEIPAALVLDGARVSVRVFAHGRRHPDDEREATLRVGADEAGSILVSRPIRRLVILRPRVRRPSGDVARVSEDDVARALAGLGKRGSVGWAAEAGPCFEDDELSPLDALDGPDALAAVDLRERISLAAARTIGLEDVVWLAVVPRCAGRPGFLVAEPDEAAAAIAIATTDALDHIDELAPTRFGSATARLRLVGRIGLGDVVLTERPRVEMRAAGCGAPYLTPYVAVGFDAEGRERVVRRIATTRPTRTGPFTCLVPVDSAVAWVELQFRRETLGLELAASPRGPRLDLCRYGRESSAAPPDGGSFGSLPGCDVDLPRVVQRAGAPVLSDVRIEDGLLSWSVSHSHGFSTEVEIEAGRSGRWPVFGRVASFPGKAASMRLPPCSEGIDRVRVVATDGWNTTLVELPLPTGEGPIA